MMNQKKAVFAKFVITSSLCVNSTTHMPLKWTLTMKQLNNLQLNMTISSKNYKKMKRTYKIPNTI